MKATIPARTDHEGIFSMDVTIKDYCLTCGGPRGETYSGLSYDGSRRLHVTQWNNPCGHTDKYSDVRKEAKRAAEWKPRAYGVEIGKFDELLQGQFFYFFDGYRKLIAHTIRQASQVGRTEIYAPPIDGPGGKGEVYLKSDRPVLIIKHFKEK